MQSLKQMYFSTNQHKPDTSTSKQRFIHKRVQSNCTLYQNEQDQLGFSPLKFYENQVNQQQIQIHHQKSQSNQNSQSIANQKRRKCENVGPFLDEHFKIIQKYHPSFQQKKLVNRKSSHVTLGSNKKNNINKLKAAADEQLQKENEELKREIERLRSELVQRQNVENSKEGEQRPTIFSTPFASSRRVNENNEIYQLESTRDQLKKSPQLQQFLTIINQGLKSTSKSAINSTRVATQRTCLKSEQQKEDCFSNDDPLSEKHCTDIEGLKRELKEQENQKTNEEEDVSIKQFDAFMLSPQSTSKPQLTEHTNEDENAIVVEQPSSSRKKSSQLENFIMNDLKSYRSQFGESKSHLGEKQKLYGRNHDNDITTESKTHLLGQELSSQESRFDLRNQHYEINDEGEIVQASNESIQQQKPKALQKSGEQNKTSETERKEFFNKKKNNIKNQRYQLKEKIKQRISEESPVSRDTQLENSRSPIKTTGALGYLFDLLKNTPASNATVKIDRCEFLSNISSPLSNKSNQFKTHDNYEKHNIEIYKKIEKGVNKDEETKSLQENEEEENKHLETSESNLSQRVLSIEPSSVPIRIFDTDDQRDNQTPQIKLQSQPSISGDSTSNSASFRIHPTKIESPKGLLMNDQLEKQYTTDAQVSSNINHNETFGSVTPDIKTNNEIASQLKVNKSLKQYITSPKSRQSHFNSTTANKNKNPTSSPSNMKTQDYYEIVQNKTTKSKDKSAVKHENLNASRSNSKVKRSNQFDHVQSPVRMYISQRDHSQSAINDQLRSFSQVSSTQKTPTKTTVTSVFSVNDHSQRPSITDSSSKQKSKAFCVKSSRIEFKPLNEYGVKSPTVNLCKMMVRSQKTQIKPEKGKTAYFTKATGGCGSRNNQILHSESKMTLKEKQQFTQSYKVKQNQDLKGVNGQSYSAQKTQKNSIV